MISWEFVLLYLAAGSIAGFLAGLLGVGGGVVIVPILMFIFAAQHFPADHMIHIAIGTSLASIMFTSVASLRAHHRHGAVDWSIVQRITPGILVGTLAGTFLVAKLPASLLKGLFIVFLFYVATQLILNIKPKPTRQLPGTGGIIAAGGIIGLVSSFVGIGGGALSVPFMTWSNVKMHNAIGTSAAIGFPIAVAGTVGYLLNGWSVADLPEGSLGFIHLPSLAGLVVASVLIAPLGARAAHRLPVATLKKVFATFLFVIGVKMLLGTI
ncbi:hypothetical protein MIZ01_2273 [Sideroxyarcus emersonii]|uniref:Probable membrane transporter protein n=1 Tax=Sideroxyarcus emersonii TaxID=2764705 RepID=A0AAN1XC53_9PROT|nr:sulfite exporter TauE/SafE family protein [Sideroxyarcus emersonii]BCK88469.1 hypothetical protein MIZ01_2273 [Sideroxyarcus emersonii]